MNLDYRLQIGGPWQTARGFLIQQLDAVIGQLAPLNPMLGSLTTPYAPNATLVTDGLGNPSFGQPQPTPIAIATSAVFAYTLNASAVYADWMPPNWDTVLALILTAPAAISIPSLAAPSTLSGVFKLIVNRGPFKITFPNQSSFGKEGNRFQCPGLVDYIIAPGSAMQIWYDVTNRNWQIVDKV